ncbi:MAG: hypothetical protein QXJ24_06140 [Thermoplasmatales archaeon]
MDQDDVYVEVLRVLRKNGYNDYVLIAKTSGGLFLRYLPFRSIIFRGKRGLTVKMADGSTKSFQYKDIVKIQSIEDLGEEEIEGDGREGGKEGEEEENWGKEGEKEGEGRDWNTGSFKK